MDISRDVFSQIEPDMLTWVVVCCGPRGSSYISSCQQKFVLSLWCFFCQILRVTRILESHWGKTMYSRFVYPQWSCWVGWEQTVKVYVEISLPNSLLGVFIMQAWFSSTFSANTKTNDFASLCAYDSNACIAPHMRQRLIKKTYS